MWNLSCRYLIKTFSECCKKKDNHQNFKANIKLDYFVLNVVYDFCHFKTFIFVKKSLTIVLKII